MQNKLVTIVVQTYNSAKFVIETLESAKAQTWPNIELIVSDDCSTDNSVELCKEWLTQNKQHFNNIQQLTVSKNTGVSGNCNRSIKASTGGWIKFIAGDDILLPNCIEDNMNFIEKNPEACIIFSQVIIYLEEFKKTNLIEVMPDEFPMNLMNKEFSAADQYKLLLLADRITYTPSYFFKKQTLLDVGGYDEENKLIEDYPMWLMLTKAGILLSYFHIATVGYRKHKNALNNNTNDGLFKPLFLKSGALKKKYVYPYLPWDIAANEKYILMVSHLFQITGINRKSSFLSFLYKFCTIYLNPFRYFIYYKKKVLKLGDRNIFYADC